REGLAGRAPETPEPGLPLPRAINALLDLRADLRPDLRAANPRLPHALEAIVARCLAPAPADRYPDAAALADDLERFLRRRPLRHAVNPSRPERAANWVRRNAPWLVLGAASLALTAALLAANYERLFKTLEERSYFLAAVEAFEDGRTVEAVTGFTSMPKQD